ncbi:hypothetical protein BRADI_3g00773v3 [Brachypodium distachyon]|uniref:Uncharacterized protein n=1 Tax=Brachypodium distachyon TaxID=15368 RepID=A0A2K2CUH0_BRADI|nr:hypothetical protein BRADI_3g00773v3 [Brachypodium distachyon]
MGKKQLLYGSKADNTKTNLPLSLATGAAEASISPSRAGFTMEEYLVDACGLTRAQALKASAKLSHLKPPSNPDAVVAFLSGGLGLSIADIAAVVAKDPRFLCASVKKTLAPNVAALTAGAGGLSRPEVASLVVLAPSHFRRWSIVSKLRYYLRLLGSAVDLLRTLRKNSRLLSADLDAVVRPNAAFLREQCGLGARDIAKLCNPLPLLLSADPERVRAMAACAEGVAVAFLSEKKTAAKVENLKVTFGWSDDEVAVAVSKAPMVLTNSKDMLRRRAEFLISEVGLEPAYIARRPVMLSYSLEGRLKPRYCVIKFLKEHGLLDHDRDYYKTVMVSEKVFMEKFICPHSEAAPHLAEAYDAACRAEVPANFWLT